VFSGEPYCAMERDPNDVEHPTEREDADEQVDRRVHDADSEHPSPDPSPETDPDGPEHTGDVGTGDDGGAAPH
jgi:hypothetical protein